MAGLKEDFGELRTRLAPFAAAEDGIVACLKQLRDARERLAADIDSLLASPEGALAERVHKFAEDKKSLDRRLSEMSEEFAKLGTLREDLTGLVARFNSALDVLAIETHGEGAAAVDARVDELVNFINATQAQVHDIERRLATFRQLRAKLGNLQAQLVPLEAEDGGIASVIEQLKDMRDSLALKIRRMEESEDGDLADRVKKFGESKRELEERVAMLSDQFRKLAAIREDIASLFNKLGTAMNASAN